MSRHTFLTSSSVFGDETETVEIISVSDVNKLMDKKNKVLKATVDGLERDNRKLQSENRKLKKKCDEMSEQLSNLTASMKSVGCAHSELMKLKARFDGFPDDCTKIFASVIDEVLSPKLDLFARQIGVVMPQVDKTGDAPHGLLRKSVTANDSASKRKSRKRKTVLQKSAASVERNQK